MELNFKQKDLNLDFLPSFDGVRYWVYEAKLIADYGITVFCCLAESAQTVEHKWKEITDYINHDYLIGELSEFERWNCYLFFICDEPVTKSLKYEIENNKFAMRKIVELKPTGCDVESPEQSLTQILNDRLLLAHINPDKGAANHSLALPELSVWGQSIVDEKIPTDLRLQTSKDMRGTWIRHALSRAIDEANDES